MIALTSVTKQLAKVFLLCTLTLFCSTFAQAEETTPSEADGAAYWDFGIGMGIIRYEQYPASDQYSVIALPAPTFQYRGKILRADDKDGAHAYLYKAEEFTVEISGAGYPALDSSNNDARKGMENLPWLLALGPQIVSRKIADHLELGLGAYQVITTDFKMTRFNGGIFEARATYNWDFPFLSRGLLKEDGYNTGKMTFSITGGTKEFQSLYYEVPAKDATTERPEFEARDGLLDYTLSYYQSFKSGRFSINVGGAVSAYDRAANAESPLHKANQSLTLFVGMNYILGGSSRPEVPADDTSGLINSIRHNRQMRDSL
jgi:MltA-interacting protein MipA.